MQWKGHQLRLASIFHQMNKILDAGGTETLLSRNLSFHSQLMMGPAEAASAQFQAPVEAHLVIKVIQVGVRALQLHHLDLGNPIFFPLQHEVGIRVLPQLILVTAPVPSSVPCTVEVPMLTGRHTEDVLTPWGTGTMSFSNSGIKRVNEKNSSLPLLRMKRTESNQGHKV